MTGKAGTGTVLGAGGTGTSDIHRLPERVVLVARSRSASHSARFSSLILSTMDRPAKPGQGLFAFIRASSTAVRPARGSSPETNMGGGSGGGGGNMEKLL